jgi:hypothetical protein
MSYQYDYAGQHTSRQLFAPVTQPTNAFTSIAFDPQGNEIALVGFPEGGLYRSTEIWQYTSSGATFEAGGYLTENIAYSKAGKQITATVYSGGESIVTVPGQAGQVGQGVQSLSIAFDPAGNEVQDVVYQDGEYYEVDSSGTQTLIASNVISASVAIDKSGNKLQDYVTADGVAHEISGGTTTTIGTNVVGISVAFDGNGGIARSVLFTDGLAYQYDYAGQHLQGQVFNPFLVNPNRLALISRLPSV